MLDNTSDPIGFNGGDWKLYRYVDGNPINFLDYQGLAKRITIIDPLAADQSSGAYRHAFILFEKFPCNGWWSAGYFPNRGDKIYLPDPRLPDNGKVYIPRPNPQYPTVEEKVVKDDLGVDEKKLCKCIMDFGDRWNENNIAFPGLGTPMRPGEKPWPHTESRKPPIKPVSGLCVCGSWITNMADCASGKKKPTPFILGIPGYRPPGDMHA